MTRAARISLTLSVLLLFGAGCTNESDKPAELSDEPSASVSASPSAISDEQAVTDVYKKYFETMQALGSADEAKVRADLAPYAEGYAIENVVAFMAYLRSQNQQPAGKVVFSALTVTVNGDSATVRECHDGATEVIVDSTTGAIISAGGVGGFETQLSKKSGSWRVTGHDQADGIC